MDISKSGATGVQLKEAQNINKSLSALGDVVAVNQLLIQLSRPMDFIGYTVSEIRQSLVDMDAMLRVLSSGAPPAATAAGAATFAPDSCHAPASSASAP